MSGDQRKLLMGGGIVAALALVIWMMWPASPAPSASAPVAPAGAQQASKPAVVVPVAPVKLDALAAPRQQPSDTERNPFRYQPKAAPPPPRPVTIPTPAVTEAPRPDVPAGPPPLPPIPLKFIGVLTRADGEKWAVLSDGKVPLHGREGDIVDGRYRIVKIGVESIELTYADGRGRQVIRFTGQ